MYWYVNWIRVNPIYICDNCVWNVCFYRTQWSQVLSSLTILFHKFESSAFAFVCFEISTLLKLEISSFRRVENFKLQKGWNQTQKQMIQAIESILEFFLSTKWLVLFYYHFHIIKHLRFCHFSHWLEWELWKSLVKVHFYLITLRSNLSDCLIWD